MASANSPVLQTTTPAAQDPAFLTLKDFQLRNGVGPWVTRVRITRMWHEVDFMRTNEVASLDLLLLDDSGDLLHAIVQKKFIWKFNWNTDVTPLEPSTSAIPRHKFVFTEFEALASANANTYLTDVVGVLTSHTNLQQLKRNSGNTCFMRELTLENISGMKLKVTLWGDSTSELTRNLEANGVNPQPIVAVVAGAYVKQYLGKASLSSTNATKIYFDVDLPEVLHIKERSSH